jgi:hypothetical protein
LFQLLCGDFPRQRIIFYRWQPPLPSAERVVHTVRVRSDKAGYAARSVPRKTVATEAPPGTVWQLGHELGSVSELLEIREKNSSVYTHLRDAQADCQISAIDCSRSLAADVKMRKLGRECR